MCPAYLRKKPTRIEGGIRDSQEGFHWCNLFCRAIGNSKSTLNMSLFMTVDMPTSNQARDTEKRTKAKRALALKDEALLAECQTTFFVAGGPGGQHRNKTASAVRIVHSATGLTVTASERRSQARNRKVALERLREALKELTKTAPPRKPSRPTLGSKQRRMAEKKRQGEKKASRRRPPEE